MTVIEISGNLDISQYSGVTPPPSNDNSLYEVQKFTYFIKINYNLNSLVHYNPSISGDMWSFDGFTVDMSNANNPVLGLPIASNININAGLISVNDISSNTLGTFPVILSISIDQTSYMTASIDISGITVNANLEESNLFAQVAYWPINGNTAPEVTSTTPDNLNQQISAIDIKNNYASELNVILNNYNNINILKDWVINLSPIIKSSYNPISNFARANNITNGNFFEPGDQVAATLPFVYSVYVNDSASNPQTLISTSNVFGVVIQT